MVHIDNELINTKKQKKIHFLTRSHNSFECYHYITRQEIYIENQLLASKQYICRANDLMELCWIVHQNYDKILTKSSTVSQIQL